MPKHLATTDYLKSLLTQAVGDEVDPDSVVIFEARTLNTLPLSKGGTIFESAVHEESTLFEMATYLKAGNTVPLHTLHNQGGELPYGRVFYGDVHRDENGVLTLNTLFYVPKSKTDIVSDLDSGVIDEVSICTRYTNLHCNECGFNYIGSDIEHLITRTCPNGHTIGEDGVHLRISGFDKMMELSLVSRGAASNTKIVGRSKTVLGKETFDRLAADGYAPSLTTLFAGIREAGMPTTEKEAPAKDAGNDWLNASGLIDMLSDLKSDNKSLKDQVASLTAERDALNAQVTELTAAADMDVEALKAAKETAEADLKAATEYLQSQVKVLCTTTGMSIPEDTSVASLMAVMDEARTTLTAMVPVGGVGVGADASKEEKKTTFSEAFKTRK